MKNKLPQKREPLRSSLQPLEPSSNINPLALSSSEIEPLETHLHLKMLSKDSLFLSYSIVLQSGTFPEHDSLTAFLTIAAGPDWSRLIGDKTLVTQIAGNNGANIVWNFPFELTFETTVLSGWPQLLISVYGTDYFGRSFLRGYGSIHLPSTPGRTIRTIRMFQPLPQSEISGLFGYIGGCVAEYKELEKVLGGGEGREVTRARSGGEVTIAIETLRHNFARFGYE